MSGLPEITDAEYEAKILKGPRPSLVKFSAEWCGPCKVLAPVVEDLAKQYAGKVDFYGLDIDQSPEVPSSLGIMSVPTIILYKGGQEVGRMVGGTKPKIEEALKKLIA